MNNQEIYEQVKRLERMIESKKEDIAVWERYLEDKRKEIEALKTAKEQLEIELKKDVIQ